MRSSKYCASAAIRSNRHRVFGHGTETVAANGTRRITVIASYHPSRQNTNTGKLTVPMFDAIFTRAKQLLQATRSASRAGRTGR